MSGNLDPSDYGGTDPYGFDPNASGNNGSGLHVDGAGTITDDLAGGRAVGVTAPGTNPDSCFECPQGSRVHLQRLLWGGQRKREPSFSGVGNCFR